MRFFVFLFVIVEVVLLSWNILETPNAYVIYPDGFEDVAVKVAGIFESIRSDIVSDFSNDPGKITIVVRDGGTYTNGFTDITTKEITFLTWPETSVWLNFSDLYETLAVHEFTHMVHLTKENGLNEIVTSITGIPAFNPQFRSPFVEAVTVYEESKRSKYGGRLNNPFMDSLVESFSKAWRYSLPALEKPPSHWFMSGNSYYIVSANFLKYLIRRYGWEKFRNFLEGYSSKILGVGLDSSFRKIYGESIYEAYEDWLDSIDFHPRGEKVLEIENGAITEVETDGKKLYFKLILYGIDSLIGKPRTLVGKIEGGRFEKIFESSFPVGRFLPTKEGIYYILKIPTEELSPGFWKYESRLEFLRWNSSKPEVLDEGYISAFDVEGAVYVSKYDPKDEVSVVFKDGKEIFRIEGFVRELRVLSGKVYMIVSREGRSSDVLAWNGNLKIVSKDPRFKHSLKRCRADMCFSMFDDDGSNVYTLKDGKIFKMTDGLVLGDYAVLDDDVYFTSFSDSIPALGVWKVSMKEERVEFENSSDSNFKIEEVEFKRLNYSDFLIEDLVAPDFRLPYILHDGTSLILGVGFAELSPDYRMIYALSPFYASEGGFGFGAFMNALLPNNFEIEGYFLKTAKIFDLEDSASLSISWTGSFAFNPWTSLIFKPRMEIAYPYDFKIGLNLLGKFKSISISSGMVLSMLEKTSIDLSISFPIFKSKFSFGFGMDLPDVGFRSFMEDTFPILHLDLGIADPLIHVGDVFAGFGVVYDEGLSLRTFLKVDFSQFLTYTRSFLKVGISMKDGTISPVLEIAQSL